MTKLEIINLALSALESRVDKRRIDFPVYWDWHKATDGVVAQLRAEREMERAIDSQNRAGEQAVSGRDSGTVGASNTTVNPGPTATESAGKSGESKIGSSNTVATGSDKSANKPGGDAKVP